MLLWTPRQPGRHVAVELKIPPDRLRPEQQQVLADLEASGFECYVWTPDDLQQAATILAPANRANVSVPADPGAPA